MPLVSCTHRCRRQWLQDSRVCRTLGPGLHCPSETRTPRCADPRLHRCDRHRAPTAPGALHRAARACSSRRNRGSVVGSRAFRPRSVGSRRKGPAVCPRIRGGRVLRGVRASRGRPHPNTSACRAAPFPSPVAPLGSAARGTSSASAPTHLAVGWQPNARPSGPISVPAASFPAGRRGWQPVSVCGECPLRALPVFRVDHCGCVGQQSASQGCA